MNIFQEQHLLEQILMIQLLMRTFLPLTCMGERVWHLVLQAKTKKGSFGARTKTV